MSGGKWYSWVCNPFGNDPSPHWYDKVEISRLKLGDIPQTVKAGDLPEWLNVGDLWWRPAVNAAPSSLEDKPGAA